MISKNSILVGAAVTALLQIISTTNGGGINAFAAGPAKSGKAGSGAAKGAAAPGKITFDKDALHRLDFKVKGSSCPVCITGIRKRMQSAPGVVKAAIMIKSPYAGVLVYDSSKTTQAKLFELGLQTTKNVTMADVEDVKVTEVPELLVPHIGEPAPAE